MQPLLSCQGERPEKGLTSKGVSYREAREQKVAIVGGGASNQLE
jgi:hypothetical protein